MGPPAAEEPPPAAEEPPPAAEPAAGPSTAAKSKAVAKRRARPKAVAAKSEPEKEDKAPVGQELVAAAGQAPVLAKKSKAAATLELNNKIARFQKYVKEKMSRLQRCPSSPCSSHATTFLRCGCDWVRIARSR